MATQAPTFGLDGSELDVMDGLFFNELTDLPVEPAHNQTLFAQPKSEPPITDEELIASLPLPHEAPAPPPAPPPPPAKPAARGAAKDAADLSETRRARNREHARRSRCRKKLIIESLQQSLTAYQAENERLRQFVRAKLGEAEAAPRLEWCEARSKGEATDTDLTGGANARMINKYDYGLLEALKHARRSFVITDPTLPDNPIVFASGARAASEFCDPREGHAVAATRRARVGLGVAAMAHGRHRVSERTHAVTTKTRRRLPLAHGLQARAGARKELSIFAGP